MPHSLKVKIKNLCRNGFISEKDRDRIIEALDNTPKEGHWIDNNNGTISCSYCHTWFNKDDRYSYMYYCPNCGAKMTDKTLISDGDECVDKALMPLIDEGYEPDIQTEVDETGNEND